MKPVRQPILGRNLAGRDSHTARRSLRAGDQLVEAMIARLQGIRFVQIEESARWVAQSGIEIAEPPRIARVLRVGDTAHAQCPLLGAEALQLQESRASARGLLALV